MVEHIDDNTIAVEIGWTPIRRTPLSWIQDKITDFYYWRQLRIEWKEYRKDGGHLSFRKWMDWVQEWQSS